MKLNKKTIIILIVVAVVGWLLWKRYKTNAVTGTDSTASTKTLDPNNLEDVITAAKINSAQAEKVRQKARDCEASVTMHDSIAQKAADKGNTFEQQVLFEALYPLFHVKQGDTWVIKSDSDYATWHAIINRVKAM